MQSIIDLIALARMRRTSLIRRKNKREMECVPVLREEMYRERILYAIDNRGCGNI